MNKIYEVITKMKETNSMPYQQRILSQLEYALQISQINDNKHDLLITNALDMLEECIKTNGTISKECAQRTERSIISLSDEAKRFKIVCAAHAHIDMNWMWGYAETVAITLDTFRTMLDMMREYPDFKFSQSQASVYSIVEEYDPVMFLEMKKRVKEGRFEVTASSWVETDKNMPNGESLARHILYTKRYLAEVLEIDPDTLNIDFEPDTFGHNASVPEILSKGGVKYFYHNRGYGGHTAYRWESPSGKSVIAYKDPHWYNSAIGPEIAMPAVRFCDTYKTKTALKVYGVGNHGGGPTRRDIEKIIEMDKWPVFPSIKFGTFAEFFESLEKSADFLPLVRGELNFIFPGCYTTQTRIKLSNRIGEAKLYEAETAASLSKAYADGTYRNDRFEEAWRKILFNHFHDILPGSGIVDTREYSMGEFQKALAVANTQSSISWRNILSQVDTSTLISEDEDDKETVSEGAGVGYGIKDFGVPQTERGRGKTRIYHFINNTGVEREEIAQIVVWDWPGDENRIELIDGYGEKLKWQRIENQDIQFFGKTYWGHEYMCLLVKIKVPAFGYATCRLSEAKTDMKDVIYKGIHDSMRTDKPDSYVLENEVVRIDIDPLCLCAISFYDKVNKKEHISKKASFRFIEEDDNRGMTSWIIGRYVNKTDLSSDVKLKEIKTGKGLLRQWISYTISFRNSDMSVVMSLDEGSGRLDYTVECDWREMSKKGSYIPQLGFAAPLAYQCEKYKYDIPFGWVDRTGMDMDVPGNSFAAAIPKDDNMGLMLITDSKYGFRCVDDSMSVTLIRSSYDPDPHPETGIHNFSFSLLLADFSKNKNLLNASCLYNHPIRSVSGTRSTGDLPLEKGFISIKEGNIAISSVKISESDDSKMIIRVYETEAEGTKAAIDLGLVPKSVCFVDINEDVVDEDIQITIEDSTIFFDVQKNTIASIMAEF